MIVLYDQGGIDGDDLAAGTFTCFPYVTVNSRDQVMFGFSASAPNMFAGAFAAERGPADTPGTVGESLVVQEGKDFYIRKFGQDCKRWGDYSGRSVDPTNEKYLWV